jgi:hypothetical protein
MPALLIRSTAVLEAMRANMQLLRSVLGNATTAEIGNSHMAPVEQRAQVDAAIASFVRRSEHRVVKPAALLV